MSTNISFGALYKVSLTVGTLLELNTEKWMSGPVVYRNENIIIIEQASSSYCKVLTSFGISYISVNNIKRFMKRAD